MLVQRSIVMAVVNYSYARQNLSKLMDEVEQDCAPVFITRQRKRGGAVLVSQTEWESIQETLYLMRNPKDAQDLRDAVAELDAGKGTEHAPSELAKRKKPVARVRRA